MTLHSHQTALEVGIIPMRSEGWGEEEGNLPVAIAYASPRRLGFSRPIRP
jgi:hypothetical protein